MSTRKIKRIAVIIMAVALLFSSNVFEKSVKAANNNEDVIVVESFDEIYDEYDGKDGSYVMYLDEETDTYIECDIETQIDSGVSDRYSLDSLSSTSNYYATATSSLSFSDSGTLIWNSTIKGRYKYTGRYVQLISADNSFTGITGTKRTITQNSYSEYQTVNPSYFKFSTTITTKNHGTFYTHQYVKCTIDGDTTIYGTITDHTS